MTLLFAHGESFATGKVDYLTTRATPESEDDRSRIKIPVAINGQETEAILDTGAQWSVCHPELAQLLNLTSYAPDEFEYKIRGFGILGSLCNVNITLVAEEGNSQRLDASIFVPKQGADHSELLKSMLPSSFIGLMGCLEIVRFAFDPYNGHFYFGAAG